MILLEPVAETAQTTRPEDTGAREVPGDQKAVQGKQMGFSPDLGGWSFWSILGEGRLPRDPSSTLVNL